MNKKQTFTIPRRCYLDKLTPAELAIRNAMLEVEHLPPNVALTEAVCLLDKAFNKVADYTDNQLLADKLGNSTESL